MGMIWTVLILLFLYSKREPIIRFFQDLSKHIKNEHK